MKYDLTVDRKNKRTYIKAPIGELTGRRLGLTTQNGQPTIEEGPHFPEVDPKKPRSDHQLFNLGDQAAALGSGVPCGKYPLNSDLEIVGDREDVKRKPRRKAKRAQQSEMSLSVPVDPPASGSAEVKGPDERMVLLVGPPDKVARLIERVAPAMGVLCEEL